MIDVEPLPYAESALEPWMSAATLRFHHDVLYAKYVARTNELSDGRFATALAAYEHAARVGDAHLREQAAQAWLHAQFFADMTPGGSHPSPALQAALVHSFGSPAAFVKIWTRAAGDIFGSGWVHLCISSSPRALQIVTSKDGWLPTHAPILTMDAWEHAYYLDYPADRAEYTLRWLGDLAHWTGASRRLARLS